MQKLVYNGEEDRWNVSISHWGFVARVANYTEFVALRKNGFTVEKGEDKIPK